MRFTLIKNNHLIYNTISSDCLISFSLFFSALLSYSFLYLHTLHILKTYLSIFLNCGHYPMKLSPNLF